MGTSNDRAALVHILQSAYSGELAAAHAYHGHWKSVKSSEERKNIRRIELEELDHRERVGELLEALGERPLRRKEIKFGAIGRTIGMLCHVIGWFFPMYFAGRLESGNVGEYDSAAEYAHNLGLASFVEDLREMADAEREHEVYFLTLVRNHRFFLITSKIFGWGRIMEGPNLTSAAPAETDGVAKIV